MLTKICVGGCVLVLVGFISIAIGVCYATAPDGGGKKASTFLSVGFSSSVIGFLAGLASLVTKLCLAIFAR